MGRRPSERFRSLGAVEIRETFTGPVSVERAARWRALAPADFRFCVEASRFITHEAPSPTHRGWNRSARPHPTAAYGGFQETPAVAEGWEATRAVADTLRAEVIVYLTPPTFVPTDENRLALYRFFDSVRTPAGRAIELPHPWATHVVEKICEDLDLVHAVDPFEREPATYGLAYFRLPGGAPGEGPQDRGSYSDPELARLKGICEEYDDAYAMFNNTRAFSDARRFSRFLER